MAEVLDNENIEKRLIELNGNNKFPWEHNGNYLEKTFVFADFISAFGFMTEAAIIAQSMDHHPEWSNVYNKVTINLTTHSAGGITDHDFRLAEAMEKCV